MLSSLESTNWDYLRYFVALAEHGSLYGAAKALGTSHSTVGRNISMLEQKLSVRLFDKVENRYLLNMDGKRILDRVKSVRDEIANIGTVLDLGEPEQREKFPLATTSFVAETLFPLILNEFFELDVSLSIDEVLGQDLSSITDETYPLAISQHRIGRSNWSAEPLGKLEVKLYCSTGYIKNTSIPMSTRLLRSHRFAVWTDLRRSSGTKRNDTLKNLSDSALIESDALNLVVQAALDGRAVAAIPSCIAVRHSNLLHVFADAPLDSLTLWSHVNSKFEQTSAAHKLVRGISVAISALENSRRNLAASAVGTELGNFNNEG